MCVWEGGGASSLGVTSGNNTPPSASEFRRRCCSTHAGVFTPVFVLQDVCLHIWHQNRDRQALMVIFGLTVFFSEDLTPDDCVETKFLQSDWTRALGSGAGGGTVSLI